MSTHRRSIIGSRCTAGGSRGTLAPAARRSLCASYATVDDLPRDSRPGGLSTALLAATWSTPRGHDCLELPGPVPPPNRRSWTPGPGAVRLTGLHARRRRAGLLAGRPGTNGRLGDRQVPEDGGTRPCSHHPVGTADPGSGNDAIHRVMSDRRPAAETHLVWPALPRAYRHFVVGRPDAGCAQRGGGRPLPAVASAVRQDRRPSGGRIRSVARSVARHPRRPRAVLVARRRPRATSTTSRHGSPAANPAVTRR